MREPFLMTGPTSVGYLEQELFRLLGEDRSVSAFLAAAGLDGLWVRDLEKTGSEWISDQFWHALGKDPTDADRSRCEWHTSLIPEDRSHALDQIQRHIEDPHLSTSPTFRFRHSDGSVVWMQLRVLVVRSEAGSPIRMLVAHKNLTELKLAEERLQQVNQEFETFAYATSHDLKAPLKSVSGQLQLLDNLCSKELPPVARTLMSNMHISLDRMSSMIDGLREYAQLVNHEFRFEPFDLRNLINNVLEVQHGNLRAIAAMVVIEAEGWMHSSPVLVHCILSNLIDNAIKYRRQDINLLLTIRGRESGAGWYLTIEDNGIGIEEKYQSRVFDLLQRLHTQDEIAGNGLGLCLASIAIQHLGGKLWLESQPGAGSTFSVFLPKEARDAR